VFRGIADFASLHCHGLPPPSGEAMKVARATRQLCRLDVCRDHAGLRKVKPTFDASRARRESAGVRKGLSHAVPYIVASQRRPDVLRPGPPRVCASNSLGGPPNRVAAATPYRLLRRAMVFDTANQSVFHWANRSTTFFVGLSRSIWTIRGANNA
jgi:hypothetical protein